MGVIRLHGLLGGNELKLGQNAVLILVRSGYNAGFHSRRNGTSASSSAVPAT